MFGGISGHDVSFKEYVPFGAWKTYISIIAKSNVFHLFPKRAHKNAFLADMSVKCGAGLFLKSN